MGEARIKSKSITDDTIRQFYINNKLYFSKSSVIYVRKTQIGPLYTKPLN